MSLHTKAKQYVKRVLITLLIFVVSFAVLSMAASVVFYGVFFTRKDTSPAYTMRYSDIDTSSYPCTQIHFLSDDNMLNAYCYTCENPVGLVVIAAGFGESGAAHLSEMMYFVDNGFNVFCYDCTGVGESEGSGTVGLSQPALDLRAALEYIRSDTSLSELPVFLYGHSAGGYAVASCADSEMLQAAAIISGFESPTLLMRETARSYVGVLADIEYPFLLFENRLVFSDRGDERASLCLDRADIPVAVYEGSDDSTIPQSVRLSNFIDFNANPNLTLTVCDMPPRNGHSGLWLTDEAFSYRESLTEGVTPDVDAANELDMDFMDGILRFYLSSLSQEVK